MLIALAAIAVLLFFVFGVLTFVGVALWLVVSTAVIGLVIGALARLVIPGRQSIGILATIAMGIAGALVGNGIGHAIGIGNVLTFLLEIGVAAVGVGILSAGSRPQITR